MNFYHDVDNQMADKNIIQGLKFIVSKFTVFAPSPLRRAHFLITNMYLRKPKREFCNWPITLAVDET